MEYEFLRNYYDIEFAIAWRKMESTEEEIEAILKEIVEDNETVYTYTLQDLLDLIWRDIEIYESPYNNYIDDLAVIKDMILTGEIDIIKTRSGYFVIEYTE